MRRLTIAGNWKMFTLPEDARALSSGIVRHPSTVRAVAQGHSVILAPPLTSMSEVVMACAGSSVRVAAQDCRAELSGAYTGDVSAPMVKALGASCVIVGHSERRRYHGETDVMIGEKASAVIRSGLVPIICVGELLDDRRAGNTNHVLQAQLDGILQGLGQQTLTEAYLAYEPVWAIGTGVAATPVQAQETHRFLRSILDRGQGALRNVPILYGGSVTDVNAGELFQCADIDGALVGGASLVAETFVAIIEAAHTAGE